MFVLRQTGRFEHGGPKYGVGLQNILGHQVFAGPEFFKGIAIGPFQGAYVVEQCVKPHITHVILVKRQLNAPGEARLGPRDAQVFQRARFQHGQHFAAVAFGPDKRGVGGDVLLEPGQVLGHAEEVILLADKFRLGQMLGAQAVFQLFFGIEALTAVAVMPAKLAKIDVPRVIHLLQEGLHGTDVLRVGGAHKAVVGHIKLGPQGAEAGADGVHKFLGRLAFLFRSLNNFVAVFVRAGEEHGILADELVVAGHGVGNHSGIGMPQMGLGINVVDGRCDEKAVHSRLRKLCWLLVVGALRLAAAFAFAFARLGLTICTSTPLARFGCGFVGLAIALVLTEFIHKIKRIKGVWRGRNHQQAVAHRALGGLLLLHALRGFWPMRRKRLPVVKAQFHFFVVFCEHRKRIAKHVGPQNFHGAFVCLVFLAEPWAHAVEMVVVVLLVRKAAEQTATNARNFCRVQKEVLLFGHAYGNRRKLAQVAAAAAHHAAVAHSTHHLCFVAHAYLAQLDTRTVFAHQVFDQIAKINA